MESLWYEKNLLPPCRACRRNHHTFDHSHNYPYSTMIRPIRSRQLNGYAPRAGGRCVIYLMSRDQRVKDNFALLEAQQAALAAKLPLLVMFHVYTSLSVRAWQHFEFMIAGLKEIEKDLESLHIPFLVTYGQSIVESVTKVDREYKPTSWYIDFSPLRSARQWREKIAQSIKTAVIEVDAHNIVPAWLLSDKEEFSAAAIRPKMKRKLFDYLSEPEQLQTHPFHLQKPIPKSDWLHISSTITAPRLPDYTLTCLPGEKSGTKMLHDFIAHKYSHYDSDRNDPGFNGQSGLSAYLHFGMISPLRVVLECLQREQENNNVTADYNGIFDTRSTSVKMFENHFLEELIVRRELAENYCLHNQNYDNFNGAKPWAKNTLNSTRADKREYVYTYEQFARAQTHDQTWNAAQKQMIKTGKMHGYMRMYWAKKILEWTQDPETALSTAVKLNDSYELDGLDPNGYVGIMWSICGVHDRPWFQRPIFGVIRYMTADGIAKKFDLKKYMAMWSSESND